MGTNTSMPVPQRTSMASSSTSSFTRHLLPAFLPAKTLSPLHRPIPNKRTATIAASVRPSNVLSLTLVPPPAHVLKPAPNAALFHVSALLLLVSAAASGVLNLGLGRRRRRRSRRPSPHLYRPIAPPRGAPAELDAGVGRKRAFRLLPLVSAGSCRPHLVGRRKGGDLARIELVLVGELVLRYGVVRARLSSDLVDVSVGSLGTMSMDVMNGGGDACNVSVGNDASCGSGTLLLPETCTGTADMIASNTVVEENLHHGSEIQRVIPAIAMAAGVMGTFAAGESGGLEMVGFVALLSFLVYDLLWASKRRMLWSELARIKDREGFMSFLLSKGIVV